MPPLTCEALGRWDYIDPYVFPTSLSVTFGEWSLLQQQKTWITRYNWRHP